MNKLWLSGFVALYIVLFVSNAVAQDEFAATLEVLNPGVEVLRVNTVNAIAIEVASVVGVGDVIRTDATGEARITFFADGTDVTILPNSEYRIVTFQVDGEDDFVLSVEVLAGQTIQRLNRVLGANSSYDVHTPGMTLAARGTEFAVRVESSGRSAMLVREGNVTAAAEDDTVDVPPAFGVRSGPAEMLSDVVQASTFDALDAALDGCTTTINTIDDVSLNVRTGPTREAERLGTIDPESIERLLGTNISGMWYRVPFDMGFGWVMASNVTISDDCAGLRIFEDNWSETATALPEN